MPNIILGIYGAEGIYVCRKARAERGDRLCGDLALISASIDATLEATCPQLNISFPQRLIEIPLGQKIVIGTEPSRLPAQRRSLASSPMAKCGIHRKCLPSR
jgi:hypothetical protein